MSRPWIQMKQPWGSTLSWKDPRPQINKPLPPARGIGPAQEQRLRSPINSPWKILPARTAIISVLSVGPWSKQQPVNNSAICHNPEHNLLWPEDTKQGASGKDAFPFLQAQDSAWHQRKLNFLCRRWYSSSLCSLPFFPRATGRN